MSYISEVKAVAEQILEKLNEKETCQFCQGYQQEELSAGLREGCVIDNLYEDEDCQIIKDDVNDIVTAFMLGKINKCPYFKGVYDSVN